MAKNNSSNNDFTNNADGAEIAGGVISRILKWLGSDITLTGSGSNTYTFPASTDTLVGRASTDTLTNKTINGNNNTITNAAKFATGDLVTTPTGAQSVTGLPFAPKLLKIYGVITSNNLIGSHSIGTFDGTTFRTLAVATRTTTGSSSRYYTTFFQINLDGPAILMRLDTFALISDGFTYNVQTANANVSVWYEAYA